MTYAIVKLGGKQYRVREGERLLVDRLALDESTSFHPEVLLVGGDGEPELAPKGVQVTAKVVAHVLGEKIRIGKYKKRTGYRRHRGFRARLSQVQIETIAKKAARAAAKAEPTEKKAAKAAAKPAADRPKAQAKSNQPARKPAARKKAE